MFRVFSLGMKEHYAYRKKVSFISPDPTAVKPEAAAMLTDGVRASHEYDHSWFNVQGGKDLELVVDLEEQRDVRRIQAGFLQFGFWLRLFPSRIEYSLSTDGKQYEPVGSIANTLPIDQYGNQQRDFTLTIAPKKARYVKLKAYSIGNTPSWHPGAGRPAVMLVDEIVVE
jgi:hexosaminidase